MKYKIGNIVYLLHSDGPKAIIIAIKQGYYKYTFLSHPDNMIVNQTFTYSIEEFDRATELHCSNRWNIIWDTLNVS